VKKRVLLGIVDHRTNTTRRLFLGINRFNFCHYDTSIRNVSSAIDDLV
jgi:hypothetical protein